MKRLLVVLVAFISIFTLTMQINAASWKFEWTNTVVRIPVGESINVYKDIPKAQLYKDNSVLSDANVSYNREGDWMYYLSDVNTSKVGEYEVWYKAYETVEYYPGTCPGYKCKVKFIVEDTKSPTLEILNSTVRLRRNCEYDFTKNVRGLDNYDTNLKMDFSSDVDFTKTGLYTVDVYLEDSSGNSITGSYNIEIFEDKKPTILYKNEGKKLLIPLNGEISLSSYFEAYDEIDGNLSKNIVYPEIDNSTLGDKEYEFSVTNFAGLSSSVFVNVSVVDEVAPVINKLNEVITLDYKENIEEYDFLKHIEITDNITINYDNLSIAHNIENKVGSYYVSYTYTDLTFTVSERIEVKLKSKVKPEIIVKDIVCYENEAIDILDYITVIDESDDKILDALEIYDEDVDYSSAGIYPVEAYVMNSSGLSETVNFTIEVIPYEDILEDSSTIKTSNTAMTEISRTDIILICIIGALVIVVAVMAVKIKKNKSI